MEAHESLRAASASPWQWQTRLGDSAMARQCVTLRARAADTDIRLVTRLAHAPPSRWLRAVLQSSCRRRTQQRPWWRLTARVFAAVFGAARRGRRQEPRLSNFGCKQL
jgi:hypothetical protein